MARTASGPTGTVAGPGGDQLDKIITGEASRDAGEVAALQCDCTVIITCFGLLFFFIATWTLALGRGIFP